MIDKGVFRTDLAKPGMSQKGKFLTLKKGETYPLHASHMICGVGLCLDPPFILCIFWKLAKKI